MLLPYAMLRRSLRFGLAASARSHWVTDGRQQSNSVSALSNGHRRAPSPASEGDREEPADARDPAPLSSPSLGSSGDSAQRAPPAAGRGLRVDLSRACNQRGSAGDPRDIAQRASRPGPVYAGRDQPDR